jgi:lipopolysaccharide transport system permease protein
MNDASTSSPAIAAPVRPAVPRPRKITVIEPRQPGLVARVTEFWRYRRLVAYFSRRFVEKRYSRTWLGWIWLPLRPALDVATRALLFGALLQVTSGNEVPYFLFFLVGHSAWHFFAGAAYWATRSLELNRRVMRRVYVPRLVPMVSSLAPSLVEYMLYTVITAIVLVYFVIVDGTFYLHVAPSTLYAPCAILVCALVAVSIGFWTAPFAVQARDVRFVLRYILGFWLFLTPVIYPLSAVPKGFQTIERLNPMTAPIQLLKLGMFGQAELPTVSVVSTAVWLLVVGVGGFVFFSRAESRALDSL